jgi:hypothetical protein
MRRKFALAEQFAITGENFRLTPQASHIYFPQKVVFDYRNRRATRTMNEEFDDNPDALEDDLDAPDDGEDDDAQDDGLDVSDDKEDDDDEGEGGE